MNKIAEFYQSGIEWSVTSRIAELAEQMTGNAANFNDLLSFRVGLIPGFFHGLDLSENITVDELVEHVVSRYGYPVYNLLKHGGEITETGWYTHPDDPDLAPLATAFICGCFVFIYEYSIVGITDLESAFVGRFD